MPQVLELGAILAAGTAVAAAAYLLLQGLAQARRALAEARGGEIVVTETSGVVVSALAPMARALGQATRELCVPAAASETPRRPPLYERLRGRIDRRLSAAGRPLGLGADDFIGFWLLWILLGAAGGFLLVAVFGLEGSIGFAGGLLLGALLGGAAWRLWLMRRLAARQTAIRRELPFAIDLLTLALDAGMDFTTAIERIARRTGGTPLGREFSLLLSEIQFGKPRGQALRDFSDRIDIAEVRSLVTSLAQAEALGTPLGTILRIQADDLRERRSQRAEEQAMRAPVKLLFPLVVFIFPTSILILFGPLLLMALRRGGGG